MCRQRPRRRVPHARALRPERQLSADVLTLLLRARGFPRGLAGHALHDPMQHGDQRHLSFVLFQIMTSMHHHGLEVLLVPVEATISPSPLTAALHDRAGLGNRERRIGLLLSRGRGAWLLIVTAQPRNVVQRQHENSPHLIVAEGRTRTGVLPTRGESQNHEREKRDGKSYPHNTSLI